MAVLRAMSHVAATAVGVIRSCRTPLVSGPRPIDLLQQTGVISGGAAFTGTSQDAIQKLLLPRATAGGAVRVTAPVPSDPRRSDRVAGRVRCCWRQRCRRAAPIQSFRASGAARPTSLPI